MRTGTPTWALKKDKEKDKRGKENKTRQGENPESCYRTKNRIKVTKKSRFFFFTIQTSVISRILKLDKAIEIILSKSSYQS